MHAGMPRNGAGDEWDFWLQGMDRAFFMRVYGKSTQIGLAAALLALGFDQKALSLGLLSGLVIGLFTLWTVEASVKLLFNGGRNAGMKLAVAAAVKLPFMLSGLLGVAWGAYHKYVNVFGVIGGVLLTHMVILIMIVSTAIANQDRNRERYR